MSKATQLSHLGADLGLREPAETPLGQHAAHLSPSPGRTSRACPGPSRPQTLGLCSAEAERTKTQPPSWGLGLKVGCGVEGPRASTSQATGRVINVVPDGTPTPCPPCPQPTPSVSSAPGGHCPWFLWLLPKPCPKAPPLPSGSRASSY